MLLQACLNGRRAPSEHRAVPVTPAEMARAAMVAVRAGAAELHVHPRAPDGSESLSAADVDAVVIALRAACPGTGVGVTTNERIVPDLASRLDCIDGWRMPPDFASVNMGEPGAPAIVARMAARGIPCEAGLATVADARRYVVERARGMAVLRVAVEPAVADSEAALAVADAILGILAGGPRAAPILLHGFEATAWPLLDRARALGLSTRIGLEDTLLLRDGTPALDNAALVRDASLRRDEVEPVSVGIAHESG